MCLGIRVWPKRFPKPQMGRPTPAQWPQSHDPIGRAIDRVCAMFSSSSSWKGVQKLFSPLYPQIHLMLKTYGRPSPCTWASTIWYARIFHYMWSLIEVDVANSLYFTSLFVCCDSWFFFNKRNGFVHWLLAHPLASLRPFE